MARPRGSRNIRGWMMTPTEMARAGLIDPADLERVEQGKGEHAVMVTGVKPEKLDRLDRLTEKFKQELSVAGPQSKLARDAAESLVEAKRATKAPRGEIERKIFAEEKRIRNNPYETAVMVTQDGRILKQKGDQFSFRLNPEQMSNSEGAIVTHNHPRAISDFQARQNPIFKRIGGSSFSPADIINSRARKEAEIRAVTPKLEYSLKNNDWMTYRPTSSNYGKFKEAYNRQKRKVDNKLWDLQRTGKLAKNEAEAAYWHLVTRQFASGNRGYARNFEYSVTGDSKALAELARIEKIYDEG